MLKDNIDMLKDNIALDRTTVLITGAAGFIGGNLSKRLLADYPGIKLIGIDNMNDYYDVRIKEERLKNLMSYPNFVFIKGSIADKDLINRTDF